MHKFTRNQWACLLGGVGLGVLVYAVLVVLVTRMIVALVGGGS